MVKFLKLSTVSTIGTSLFIALVGKGVQATDHCTYNVTFGVDNATDTMDMDPGRLLAEAEQVDDPLGFSLRRDLQADIPFAGYTDRCNFCRPNLHPFFANVVCNNDQNNWQDGRRTFMDDGLFPGGVCEINVRLFGTCGINAVEVYINDNLIGDTTSAIVMSPNQECVCAENGVCQDATVYFDTTTKISHYMNGMNNEIRVLDISGSAGGEAQLCMDYAEIEVHGCDFIVPGPETPAPTMSPAPTMCDTESGASCGGDPHFQPIMATPFSYHGQFDGVLMASKEFNDGQGLDIHIRTTRVDNAYVSYSYISGAAVRVGNDVLEVKEDGSILVNGAEELFDGVDTADFGEVSIVKSTKGSMHQILTFDIEFPSADMSIQIRANTKNGLLFVDVLQSAPRDAVGLLGSPLSDELFARDGTTDMTGAWNSFGEEWQVQSDEAKLFQDKDREPQHPASCVYQAEGQESAYVRRRRRHLMENERVTMEAATAACEGSSESKMQFCIDDVLAMGDVDLAEDSFYNQERLAFSDLFYQQV